MKDKEIGRAKGSMVKECDYNSLLKLYFDAAVIAF